MMLDTDTENVVADASTLTDVTGEPLAPRPASKEEAGFGALMRLPEVKEAQSALPGSYALASRGLQMMTEDKDGNPLTLWLCAPLAVCGKARTHDGADWSTVLRFIDRDLVVRQELVADADLHGGSGKVLAKLAFRGLDVASNKASREGLIDLLRAWTPPARYRLVDCLGWTDRDYKALVLGDGTVIGAERVLPRPHVGAFLKGMDQVNGRLPDWIEQVGKLCIGNPLMMVSVSLAFSAPLLAPLGMEGGGLHLRGASSTGKSTLLRLANSVWGATSSIATWNGTRNALEWIAASHSGRLLALDEIGEADPRSVGDTAYALANGQGKSRLNPSLSRTDLHWRLAVMSSGEESLAGHMARAGRPSRAGQEVRLLDIPTDLIPLFVNLHGRSDSRTFVRELTDVLVRNHGTAGPAFVRSLVGCLGRYTRTNLAAGAAARRRDNRPRS